MSKIDPDYELLTAIQSRLVDVITELESDLSDLRENNYSKQESIDSKNQQIEDLIKFNNDVDQLLKLSKYQISKIDSLRRGVDELTETVIDNIQNVSEVVKILTDKS